LKQHRLSEYFRKPGEEMEVTQQAFSKARNQISEYPLRTLFEQQIQDEYQGLMGRFPARSDSGWTYLAVDGTKIALPNLPELRGSISASVRAHLLPLPWAPACTTSATTA
jgi:hypothetical protein